MTPTDKVRAAFADVNEALDTAGVSKSAKTGCTKRGSIYVVTHLHNGSEVAEMIGDRDIAEAAVNDFAAVGIQASLREVTK